MEFVALKQLLLPSMKSIPVWYIAPQKTLSGSTGANTGQVIKPYKIGSGKIIP
jgi:hypothetical protein